jgi:hypothetical protein
VDVAGGQEMVGGNGAAGVMAKEFERWKKSRKGRILRG